MTKIIIDIPVINCEIRALKPDIQIPMPNTDAENNHIYALNIASFHNLGISQLVYYYTQ
jgi:hypothetical protein